MSSALRLLEAGREFLLISENLGGRIQYSEEYKVNYGAYFAMKDYRKAKALVQTSTWINPADACFHNSESERFSLISAHTLKLVPELLRFLGIMIEFARHYSAFKNACLNQSQKEALQADAYMADLFNRSAASLIKERGLQQVANDFVAKFAYACTGASTDQMNALDFLNVSMGMITPIRHLVFDKQAVARKFGSHLILDSITLLEQKDGGYVLTGKSGEVYRAVNVVVATPAAVTQQLLHLPEIREACKIYVYHLHGVLKPEYRKFTLNLFPYSSPFMLISREHDGSYLVYSREDNADLARFFEKHELIQYLAWEKAMYIMGRAFMEQELGNGLYVAGDHNGLGLEPAAISGIYAANKILAKQEKA